METSHLQRILLDIDKLTHELYEIDHAECYSEEERYGIGEDLS
jgi:hypothetical protein